MKLYEFKIVFASGEELTKYANSPLRAMIKAMYSKMEKGEDYEINYIENTESGNTYVFNTENFKDSLIFKAKK